MIKRQEILTKSKIKKKTAWTVFLLDITINDEATATNEKK
jgi:hypothetical protein